MTMALLGRKIGMTQVFDEDGVLHPVTVIKVGPCQVLQVRTPEVDGYHALQLGFEDKPRRKANDAERGHVGKIKAEPKRYVREVRLQAESPHQASTILDLKVLVAAAGVEFPEAKEGEPPPPMVMELFKANKLVDVSGIMKGRGYTGVMKRYGFRGLETTHGVQTSHRSAGSTGCNTQPGRVIKGKRMAGQHGNTKKTVCNLRLVRADLEHHCLLVRGAIPGPNGGLVTVRVSKRQPVPKKAATKKKGK